MARVVTVPTHNLQKLISIGIAAMNQQSTTMAQKYRVASKIGTTDDETTKTNQKQSQSGLKIRKIRNLGKPRSLFASTG